MINGALPIEGCFSFTICKIIRITKLRIDIQGLVLFYQSQLNTFLSLLIIRLTRNKLITIRSTNLIKYI